MKKLVNSVALLAITANLSIAGGHIKAPKVTEPIEVEKAEIVIEEDKVQYDGLYVGAGINTMSINEAVTTEGYALTFIAGYYFNKYFGIEGRYSRTVKDVNVDHGAEIVSENDVLENFGIYFKPMYNLTTGFSFYGLAGYGQSIYEKENETYREKGFQWGLGAKYELAEGLGIFIDYLDMYNNDNFNGILVEDITYRSLTVGTTYTF